MVLPQTVDQKLSYCVTLGVPKCKTITVLHPQESFFVFGIYH
ncbi:hypothetical protein C5167_005816 [Papaver somniferum]|uniref:Uncharacterized protein n=1 Tax=Papaver somniferum TaxID=3469 RepID=A0A4Y7JCG2_PAPSO|nr:hypothetical protein C5167_005816 [Papaver somniferum]